MSYQDNARDAANEREIDALRVVIARQRAALAAIDSKIGHFADKPILRDIPELAVIIETARAIKEALKI